MWSDQPLTPVVWRNFSFLTKMNLNLAPFGAGFFL